MKQRFLIIVLMVSVLTSCVAVVVAGAAAGLIVYDRRSVTVLEKDARIYHTLHTEFVTNPSFKNSRIIVVSFNQVVLLIGQTPEATLRGIAEKIARNTPAVRRVYNQINVTYPINLRERAQDTWLTGQIRTLMLNQKGLESGSIRIITEGRVVYLMGIVTTEQANLAVFVARQVKGVQKVVKVFQYIR